MTQVQFLKGIFKAIKSRTLIGIATVAFVVSGFGSASALADEYDAAEAKLSNSYNEYYHAIRSGKAQNKQDVMRLQQEIIGPAASGVTKVLVEKEQAAILKHIGKTVTPQEAKALRESGSGFEDMDPKDARAEALKMVEDQNKDYAKIVGAPVPADGFEVQEQKGNKKLKIIAGAPSKKQKREEVVLDGKNIEKEITFPGASRSPASKTQAK